MSKADLFNAAKSRDLEWAVWKKGERIHSIPAKTRIEREAEDLTQTQSTGQALSPDKSTGATAPVVGAPAPKPEEYTKF